MVFFVVWDIFCFLFFFFPPLSVILFFFNALLETRKVLPGLCGVSTLQVPVCLQLQEARQKNVISICSAVQQGKRYSNFQGQHHFCIQTTFLNQPPQLSCVAREEYPTHFSLDEGGKTTSDKVFCIISIFNFFLSPVSHDTGLCGEELPGRPKWSYLGETDHFLASGVAFSKVAPYSSEDFSGGIGTEDF